MNRILIILSAFLISLNVSQGVARGAQEIVAVQSIGIRPYQEALDGFKNACGNRIHRFILSEMTGVAAADKISEIKPALILAIGIDALTQVSTITDIPVVYLMVLNPPSPVSAKKNVYGVRMAIPQEQQFRALFDVMPAVKTVGLLYNPDRTGGLAGNVTEIAGKHGIKTVAKVVRNPRSVPRLLQELKGRIDAFLMLPDLTVITPETVEALLLFSLENRVPLVSFSEKYVEMGALMSIGVDAFDMGAQAGEMAKRILSGGALEAQQVDARKAVISINKKVAKTLGISINERAIGKVKIID